jgi:hypothetical protein
MTEITTSVSPACSSPGVRAPEGMKTSCGIATSAGGSIDCESSCTNNLGGNSQSVDRRAHRARHRRSAVKHAETARQGVVQRLSAAGVGNTTSRLLIALLSALAMPWPR